MSQAVMRSRKFAVSSHRLENCGKLYRNFSVGGFQYQTASLASGLVTSLCIRSVDDDAFSCRLELVLVQL